MSLAAPYQEHYYIADGEMVTFPFGDYFQALSASYVKCAIYFSDGTSCVPTFTVDMTNQQITIVTLTKPDGTVLTVPPEGSVVRVYRETPEQQNVTASQLQNYTAKQLEKIFDSMVAMTQETSYSDLHKTVRLTEPQRDLSIDVLTEANDQSLLYWDEESRKIKATDYAQDEVIEQIERANTVADEAKTIAGKARDDLRDHKMDKNNPHETSLAKLTDTDIRDPERFQFLSFDGRKWKNVNYSSTCAWGAIIGTLSNQTDLQNALNAKASISSLAAVATSGNYNDLNNKPTIPTKTSELTNDSGFITSSDIPVTDVTVGGSSVVSSGVAVIPAIPTVNNPTITITQGGVTKGSFSLNQSSSDTIALDAGGGGSSYTAGDGIDITSDVISVANLDCGTM